VYIHEIGGTETHVHLAVSIAPTLLISEFVGQLKGASAHDANQKFGHKVVEWQSGYGVVSFGTGDLDWVNAYVRSQKERHAHGNTQDRLERIMELEEEAKAGPREGP
jgi:putative transposase